jgi:ribosomal protein S18 acetylase RimI-like enzyme
MGEQRLRTASVGDIDALVGLWEAAGLGFRRHLVRPELINLLQHHPDPVMVIEVDGSPVASIMGTFDGRRGWVNRLATHPDHRGRGLARRLLLELEARLRAKGCRKLNLLVEPDNAGIVAFYERYGYQVEELIFMEKFL